MTDHPLAAVIAAALLLGAAWLIRARLYPYGPCPLCRRRKGRGIGSTRGSWNRCARCGGSGEVLRLSARIWPKWRNQGRRQ